MRPAPLESALQPWSDLGNLWAVGHVVGHAVPQKSKKPQVNWGLAGVRGGT
ncbi:hypothetical protein GKQ77_10125 [Streptomyces sp. BG9H]|uniref:Uncharacterized protein n=1 Tax=Streptomyces anatolicus TaxID=2675858 RepID=A0ABS6YKH7_9ACTN|nr:hypothetical protein [Streptomyces anatolicus]